MMLPAVLTTLLMREPPVSLRTQLQAARYGFSHQLISVFVLIVLLAAPLAGVVILLRSGGLRTQPYVMPRIRCIVWHSKYNIKTLNLFAIEI